MEKLCSQSVQVTILNSDQVSRNINSDNFLEVGELLRILLYKLNALAILICT